MDIKERIIERINDINDPQLLAEILQAIELEKDIEQFHQLTNEEKVAIDEGIEDAESGNLYSNREAGQLFKKWLKK